MRRSIVIGGALAQKAGHGGLTWGFLQFNLRYLTDVMDRFGLSDRWALVSEGRRFIGLSRDEVLDRAQGSVFLLNVMGYLNDKEILGAAPRRIFLDIDPGFPQMWQDLGLADMFDGHDDFVTVGANLGTPGCDI